MIGQRQDEISGNNESQQEQKILNTSEYANSRTETAHNKNNKKKTAAFTSSGLYPAPSDLSRFLGGAQRFENAISALLELRLLISPVNFPFVLTGKEPFLLTTQCSRASSVR